MAKLKSLRLQAYDFVLDRIKEGYYDAGEKISEEDLMEELGVSRTPIKEALLLLTAHGILDNQSRRGFFVRDTNPTLILENNDIIGHLDAFAAELTINLLTEDDLALMKNYANEMETALSNLDLETYEVIQKAFHKIYIDKSPNKQLPELIEQLRNKYVDTISLSTDTDSLIKMTKVCNDQHFEIIELFRKKDIDNLTKLLIEHWRTPYVDTFGINK